MNNIKKQNPSPATPKNGTSYKPTVKWKDSTNKGSPDSTNKPEPDRGRRNEALDAQRTPFNIIVQVDAVYDRMKAAFEKFLAKQGWTNARAYREFSPYISNPAAVTKILKGEQKLAFEVLLVMALRFNEPLDEVLLGRKVNLPVLNCEEQEIVLRLAEKIKSCSGSNG